MTGAVQERHPLGWSALVLVGLLLLSLAAPGAASAQEPATEACPAAEVGPAPFPDRPAIPAVHRFPVDCAFWHEIVEGFADDHYHPARAVRRDQMASFVGRALGAAGVELPEPAPDRFTDVDPASPHDDAIHRLAAAGVVHGGPGELEEDAYGPALSVRRDQMASFLLRAVEFATGEELGHQEQRFPDVPAGNAHFSTVNGAHDIGLARGHADGTYRPHGDVRRDQMGAFVVRLVERLLDVDPTTVWTDHDLSGNESVQSGARYDSPADALDALVAHMEFPVGAQVSHQLAAWSATHGVVEVRNILDDSISGEDVVVSFLEDAGGWHADPVAQIRSHCRRGVAPTEPTLCL